MKFVVVDQNALIGMQIASMRPRIEPYLADENNLLIVTDHFILEASRTGAGNLQRALSALIPYRERVRAGRRHSELFTLEMQIKCPSRKNHLLTADGRSEHIQDCLERMGRGADAFKELFDDPDVAKELARRNDLDATAALVHVRYDAFEETVDKIDARPELRGDHEGSLRDRLRTLPDFDRSVLEMCMVVATVMCEKALLKDRVGERVARRLANEDSFSFRHELAYALRIVQLRRNDLLKSWMNSGKKEKIRNEHFDVEFVALASYADIALTDDNATREHLELLGRALQQKFGAYTPPLIAPERATASAQSP